jgi:hypothetical protein
LESIDRVVFTILFASPLSRHRRGNLLEFPPLEIMSFFRVCLVLGLTAGAAALTPQEAEAMRAALDLFEAAQQRGARASSSGPTVSAVGGSLKLSSGNDVQISVGGEEVVTISSGAATDSGSKSYVTQTLGAAKMTVSEVCTVLPDVFT